MTIKVALILNLSFSARAHAHTHFRVPHGRNNRYTWVYIRELFNNSNRTEWMKGICLIWSRGRHISPSLPGDRYLKLGSKSDLRAEISGSIVWYEALAPRPEVLRSISCNYGNSGILLNILCFCCSQYEILAFAS